MNQQSPTPIDAETLERYLDGLLSPDESRELEQRLAGDPAALEQVVAHRRMVAGLTEMFAPASEGTSGTHTAPVRRMSIGRLGVIAAALLLVAGGVWVFAPRPAAPELRQLTDAQWKQQTLDKLREQYEFRRARQFKPDEVCTTDAEFAAWTHRAFGVALRPVRGGAGPEPVFAGWSRATMFSSYTGVLLGTVEGQPVVVAMDVNVPARRVPADDATGPLRVFVRQIGDACVFEVTPRNAPGIINQLELAPAPHQPATDR